MALLTRGLVLVIITLLTDNCSSQNSVTPLWPCYSVFKLQLTNSVAPLSSVYRYISKLVTSEGEVHNPDDPDCVFTLEGPPNSRIELQLLNVVIQRPGYVSTSSHNAGNCSIGAVRIYNFTVTGALVQVNEVCSSFQTGMKIMSDTNIAVVTSTIARGHFDLQATIIPENDTGRNYLTRSLPTRNENVIRLGHTKKELNIISTLLNPAPQIEPSFEKSLPNSSDEELIQEKEIVSDYYDDVDSNEDLNYPNNQLSNIENNQFIPTINHTDSHNMGNQFDKQRNSIRNHKVSQFTQPINNQNSHQTNDLFPQYENQISQPQRNHFAENEFIQQHSQLEQPMNNPVQSQFSPQNNFLSQFGNLVTGSHSSQQNEQLSQPENNLLHSQLANQQNSRLNQLLSQLIGNQLLQQHKSQLNQPVNQPTEQLTRQQVEQLNQFVNHPDGNQFTQKEQISRLNQVLNQLIRNQYQQQQNEQPNQPTNPASNSVTNQFTPHFEQPQNQLIGHIKNQHTQTLVKRPSQQINTANSQIHQTDLTRQPVNQITQLEKQQNEQENKLIFPVNQFSQQNDQLKQLMNILTLQENNPLPGQQENHLTQFSQQNTQITPTPQPIHSANIQFSQQMSDQFKQFVNTANNQLSLKQNSHINEPTIQQNQDTIIPFTQQSDQSHHLLQVTEHQLSNQLNVPTNEISTHIMPTENSQIASQMNGQMKQHLNQLAHNQLTQALDVQPISHQSSNANNQAFHKINNQLNEPMDKIMDSSGNHIHNSNKNRFNQIENHLLQLAHNQVTGQTNTLKQKLVNSNQMLSSNNIGHPDMDQLKDRNDHFHPSGNVVVDHTFNTAIDQSSEMKNILPENNMFLPVMNQFNQIVSNQSIYRENSKFTNPDKNLFLHVTDHETSQSRTEINTIETSTEFNVAEPQAYNTTIAANHKPFISGEK